MLCKRNAMSLLGGFIDMFKYASKWTLSGLFFQKKHSRRESCSVCDGGEETCQVVSKTFTREVLPAGYQFLATIPAGSCNICIIATGQTKNYLALRYSLSTRYFLNGDWFIEKGGHFSAGQNSFTYNHSNMAKDGKVHGDQIHFSSQLTHAIEVYLVVQGNL